MENIIYQITEALSQPFMIKALITGIFIAVPCSILGVFLVLKNMSLIGDGLAHVSFAAIAIGLLLSVNPIIIALPIVVLGSFLILTLKERAKVNADSSIGMLSSTSVAVGVLIASLAGGFNVDLFSFLFGSILFISNFEVGIAAVLSIGVIATVILFYNDLFAVTFDEEFAKLSGVNITKVNYILAIVTSLTIVLGIRIVGTLLISSLIVFPAVFALQFKKKFKMTILFSIIFSVSSVILGILLSYIFNLPTGASIVCVNALAFGITLFWRKYII